MAAVPSCPGQGHKKQKLQHKQQGIKGRVDEAKRRCFELYPEIGTQLTGKNKAKDAHRADAILIAAFGLAMLEQGLTARGAARSLRISPPPAA
jgi:hypothetical protein